MDFRRRKIPEALGVRTASRQGRDSRERSSCSTQPNRSLHRQPAEGNETIAQQGNRQGHLAAEGDLRPDRVTAQLGGTGYFPGRQGSQGRAQGSRTFAGQRCLRRTNDVRVARRRPLRRHLRIPTGPQPSCLALARLGIEGVSPKPQLRPIRDRANRRGSASRCHPRPDPRNLLQSTAFPKGRGGKRAGGIPNRVRGGPCPHLRHGLSRADLRVLPLPRSQVRPDHPKGLLFPFGLLQQRRRGRPLLMVHQFRAHSHTRPRRPAERREGQGSGSRTPEDRPIRGKP